MPNNSLRRILEMIGSHTFCEMIGCEEYTVSCKWPDRASGMDMEATKKNICEMIKTKGLKDRAIAEKMGVTPQAVNKWRHKGTFLVIDNLYIISGMLGVSIDELIIPKTWKEQTFLIETRC
ncbi:helix-turn-helix domain-containing protein [Oribacterium sp. FC2011]|uniref:helix-turn-helix domain-containing protein n=1 Tax=Oribacterium sp. FC2011 TaxID=1408311 RepID=UPI0012DD194A|nr:helix-turn-helix transcriptional regulator [Oribacterium sp. FC2011]